MAKNTEKWGRETAKARYGGSGIVTTGVMDQESCCENQDPIDKQRADYPNIATGWVRGAVGKPTMTNETAENYGTTDVPRGQFDKASKTGKL